MGTLSRRENLISVAKLYYIGEYSQSQIAKTLGISQTKVSLMLKQCKEEKLIQFQIATPPSHYSNMADKIKRHLKLNDVIVIPAEVTSYETQNNIAIAASQYISKKLHDSMRIGISWGTTLAQMVEKFEYKKLTGCSVLQLTGELHTNSLKK